MAGGLKFSTLFFILIVSFWLSSMLYATEARPLNALGLPNNAGETEGVFAELSKKVIVSSRLSSSGRGKSYKYSLTGEIKTSGPSPGEGHKNVPKTRH
jgi:hypothetical protein